MSAPAETNAELMPSLRRLLRGLSALFWGLPLALITCVQSAVTDWLRPLGMLPPIITTGLFLYGLNELSHFQKQERVWTDALDRTKMFALVNLGLSPFIYWWNQFSDNPFFTQAIIVMAISSLLFLVSLNFLLQRLTAMLPDEMLRAETKVFTQMNLGLIAGLVLAMALFQLLTYVSDLPVIVIKTLDILNATRRAWLLLLALLPLAMTMTLLWKTKEVVLSSIFGNRDLLVPPPPKS
ncbi:MAG: hypothetical protein K0Q55_1052 [Verrucomicrobia bacterium]|nr:hypothetical protein [Verrucomicrobiota bacterium]